MLSLKVKEKGFLKINSEKSLIQIVSVKDKTLSLKIYNRKDNGTYTSATTYLCPIGVPTKVLEDLELTYIGGGNNSIRLGFVGSAEIRRAIEKISFTVGSKPRKDDFDFNFDTSGY